MGVMIVSVIGCLGSICEVIRIRRWGSASFRYQAAHASCLLGGLGHERVVVSMFCCDAGPLVRLEGRRRWTPCLLVLCWAGRAPKAFIGVKRVVVAVTVHGTSRKAKG